MAFLRLTLIPLAPLVFLMYLGCSYDEPRPDRTELIAGSNSFGKTWQISNIQVELGTITPHRCVTDNYVTYYPSGRYEVNEGATKCDPSDPPALVGTWVLDDSGETLIISIDGAFQYWNIESLSSESLNITTQFEEGYRTYSFYSSN